MVLSDQIVLLVVARKKSPLHDFSLQRKQKPILPYLTQELGSISRMEGTLQKTEMSYTILRTLSPIVMVWAIGVGVVWLGMFNG